MVLKKGTILYSLVPGGKPGFAVTNHTVIAAKGSPERYHELTQVVAGEDEQGNPRELRNKLQVYRLKKDLCVAKGKALAQDPKDFGSGGATQYYISPSDSNSLSKHKIRNI